MKKGYLILILLIIMYAVDNYDIAQMFCEFYTSNISQ